MKYIIGKKQEMTQIWQGENVVAVTKITAGPCVVTQVKNEKKDGYEAIQLGYGDRKAKNIAKPQKGHFKKLGNFSATREFRDNTELNLGDQVTVDTFAVGDTVDVIGTTKGKGFQGVVKRWGFKGSKKTHGNKDQLRMPGSIGATGPAHVFKGTKMGGRMGGDRQTMKNLEVVKVNEEENSIYIRGGVPGSRNSLVMIVGEGELKITKKAPEGEKKAQEVEAGALKEESKNKEAKEPVKGVKKEKQVEAKIEKQDKKKE